MNWGRSPLVPAGGLVLLLTAWGSGTGAGAEDISPDSPTAQAVPVTVSLSTALARDNMEHRDAGTLHPDEPVFIVLQSINDLPGDVGLVSVRTDCDCTVTDSRWTVLPPGESDALLLRWDLRGRSGSQTLSVALELNIEDRAEYLHVVMTAQIDASVSLRPRRLLVNLPVTASLPERSTARVHFAPVLRDGYTMSPDAESWGLQPLGELPAGFTVSRDAVGIGGQGEFEMAVDAGARSSSGELVIPLQLSLRNADGEILQRYRRSVEVMVRNDVRGEWTPPELFMGRGRAGDFPLHASAELTLNPSLPFRIVSPTGGVGEVRWSARPITAPAGRHARRWALDVVASQPARVGICSTSILIRVAYTLSGREASLETELPVSFIRRP